MADEMCTVEGTHRKEEGNLVPGLQGHFLTTLAHLSFPELQSILQRQAQLLDDENRSNSETRQSSIWDV